MKISVLLPFLLSSWLYNAIFLNLYFFSKMYWESLWFKSLTITLLFFPFYDRLQYPLSPIPHQAFQKLMCSLSRSFIMPLRIPTISMHLQQECCSILCMFLSISITFSLIFLCVMRVNNCFSATHTLIFRTSFSFLSSSNLESIILCFSLNSLLSFMSSVCLLIILFCSFKANSINWSLVIFSSCFLVKMMLPDIFIRFLSRHSLLVEDMPVLNEWY